MPLVGFIGCHTDETYDVSHVLAPDRPQSFIVHNGYRLYHLRKHEFGRTLYGMADGSGTSKQYAFLDPTRAALKSYEGSIFHLPAARILRFRYFPGLWWKRLSEGRAAPPSSRLYRSLINRTDFPRRYYNPLNFPDRKESLKTERLVISSILKFLVLRKIVSRPN